MKHAFRRALALICLVALSAPVLAGEAEVRKALAGLMGEEGSISSLRKVPYGNFYEVVLKSGEILYADDKGGFVLSGQIIDLKTKKNITAIREAELSRVAIADLPLAQAVKIVRGTGKRTLVTFEDPNCGYCKKLVKEHKGLKDTTIYTFMIPILAQDSLDKSRNIWCAKDQAAAWNDWMVDGKAPADAQCDNPIAKNAEMARKYRISGTPTMFLADGSRIGGYVPLDNLDKQINEAEAKARK